MEILKQIHQKARARLKTIVLPEYNDNRTVEAARIIQKEGIAKAILLTPDRINSQDKESYIQEFYQMRQHKGIDIDTVRKLFDSPLYYAAMMTRKAGADGFVAGASLTTPDVVRTAIWCLGVDKRIGISTSAFIMIVPNSVYGEKGTFVFADCGIIPEPSAGQIACIARLAAELAQQVLDFTPRIALLSYSTKGSAKGKNIDKMVEALGLLRQVTPELLADGELQVDAAIVPEVARIKSPDSPIEGRANVLIFPDLEAGNIGYKLVQRLSAARAIGPLILGLNKPASDLSRGCSVEDIVDSVAVTAVRAQ